MSLPKAGTPDASASAGERLNASNGYDTREAWLRAAVTELRPYFNACGHPLPNNIRMAIGFPSSGRHSAAIGECWSAYLSADEHFEIFIRADKSDPVEVLGILAHELVHAVVGNDAGHGKPFKDAALKIGLEGKMRQAAPGDELRERLAQLADTLGPLPHAKLDISRGPADRPKKQGTRMLKAVCDDCGYTVRIAAKWIKEVGEPHCPDHGQMTVDMTTEDAPPDAADASGDSRDEQVPMPQHAAGEG